MADTQWTATVGDAGVRLDKYLAAAERLGSRAKAVTALERGKIYVNEAFRSHGKRRPFIVHRIDQDTSSFVVFAKNAESQRRLKAQFARR
nr:RNA pseudouridine synthase [Acidobacteriota bacterium]